MVTLRKAETAVTDETGALVRHGHCAQPGDNTVDRRRESVGIADRTWDGLWFLPAAIPPIPSSSLSSEGCSTTRRARQKRLDLHKHRFSTVSTVLMTTSFETRN